MSRIVAPIPLPDTDSLAALHKYVEDKNGTSDAESKADSTLDGESELRNRKPQVILSSVSKDEPIVNRRELWSYYLYYNGDNGVGPMGFAFAVFQSLANEAGYDPAKGPGSKCNKDDSAHCLLPWGNGTKTVSSVGMVANGISFTMMSLIFTTIGSAADYGHFGRWLLLLITCICWASQFVGMAIRSPSGWPYAMLAYIIGFISYGATLVFYAALFPRLARNTQHSRDLREKHENGETEKEIYELEENMELNRISNISTMHSNIGYIAVLCLNLSLLLPIANNPHVNNYVLALINAYWVATGIWWFIFQQSRPGPPLPKGEHYLTIGWKQIWVACKQYKKLPYTFIYLFAYFLLADGLNTTGTVIFLCQNDKFSFNFLQGTYVNLGQAITSTVSTYGFWHIQRYWKINAKRMFVVTNFVTIMIPLWGMIGLWTDKIGFHNMWEFWAYNVVFGLFQAPYYAFSQTIMAELTPPGFENMFFGLFGLSNRASSMIGPYVVQAIIDKAENNWKGFPFLFALCTIASLVVWFGVNVETGRRNAESWAKDMRKRNAAGKGIPASLML